MLACRQIGICPYRAIHFRATNNRSLHFGVCSNIHRQPLNASYPVVCVDVTSVEVLVSY